VELGFDPDHRILMSVRLGNHGYSEAKGMELITSTLDRLENVPGVWGVSTCHRRPFWGSWTMDFTPPGTGSEGERFRSAMNLAGPGYFEVMGIPLVVGRDFNQDDVMSAPRVAIVSEEFAERMWPGESPLGKPFPFLSPSVDWEWTVVGVACDAIYYSVREATWPMVYLPHLQLYQGRMTFVVATRDDPHTMIRPVEQAMRELDPNLAIEPLVLADLVEEECAPLRIWSTFVALFATLALILSAAGLYGLQAFLVTRRYREIGIRMALGSAGRRVLLTVIGRGLLLSSIGSIIGTIAALGTGRLVRSMLFGVSPHDPAILVEVPLVLITACALASLIPALRASRVNPVEVLRQE
jgi:putative ABC transport system permease protein